MGWQGLGGRRELVPGRRPGGGAAAAGAARWFRPWPERLRPEACGLQKFSKEGPGFLANGR